MELKYKFEFNNKVIIRRLKNLTNQIYKLLPIREEQLDWEKPLETIIEQLGGIQRLMQKNTNLQEIFFPLLNKLEGLYILIEDKDFSCYRRTIFECLGLIQNLIKAVEEYGITE